MGISNLRKGADIGYAPPWVVPNDKPSLEPFQGLTKVQSTCESSLLPLDWHNSLGICTFAPAWSSAHIYGLRVYTNLSLGWGKGNPKSINPPRAMEGRKAMGELLVPWPPGKAVCSRLSDFISLPFFLFPPSPIHCHFLGLFQV